MLSAAPLGFLALAILAYAVRLYRQARRLKDFKGPFGTAFSSLWMLDALLSKSSHLKLADACEKYGSVTRIGPNTLITSSPELLMRMNAARSPYTRGKWYKGARLEPGHDNLFTQRDAKLHSRRRAQMASGYSGKENPCLEVSIDAQVQNLLRLIHTKYLSTATSFKPMDLARTVQYFTLDTITDIAFGQAFGDLVLDEDVHKYIKSTEEILPAIVLMTTFPILNDLVQTKWMAKMFFPSDKDGTGIGRWMSVAKRIIGERFGPKAVSRPDMLGSFIRHGVQQEELVSEALLQILAGSDTSATSIRATMLYLITNPSTYRTLQNEIDAAVKTGQVSSPVIQMSEAQALPYLQAVIKEGIRIWPAATGLVSKVVPPEGDMVEIDGKEMFLPGGTDIGYCAWGVHHRKAVFGDDAHIFRPERWLTAPEAKLAEMQKTGDLAFGYGKYHCLGKNVAMIELNKVFFELLRNFDFSLVDPTKPWKSECVTLWSQSNMWVRITERTRP